MNPQTIQHIHALSAALRGLAQCFDDLTLSQVEPREGVDIRSSDRQQPAQKEMWRSQPQRSRSREADDENSPSCPDCGAPMRKRTSSRGPFWGCSRYPQCKATYDARTWNKMQQRRESLDAGRDD